MRTSSASATSRCCAPSCRSRSILRRAASAASTMRARDARSSSVRACSISRRRSASSAARRSVMSKIAPSHHSRPPAPETSWPRSSTQRISPSARTIRYSSANGPSSDARRRPPCCTCVAVVGVHDAQQRPLAAGDEVRGRVAGDPLDLVADQLEREVGVPGRAVDRAGHVGHQRAHERVVGALLGGAQAGARPGEQLGARERAVQVVVGAGVERGVGRALRGRRR